jgi:cardiolipin-specific phospholipase
MAYIVRRGINKLMVCSSLTSWYWPTSLEKAALSESRLMDGLEMTFKDVPILLNSTSRDNRSSFIHCAYNDKGKRGMPVVMAHGLGAGLAFFYKNYKPLIDDGWPLYTFDWLGMGRSGRPPFPHYPENSVDSIINFFIDGMEKWREHLKLNQFILIGHSLGGYLSCLYALKHPNRVHTLILSSPVGLPPNSDDGDNTGRLRAVTGHEMPPWLVSMWNSNYTPQALVRGFGPMGPQLTRWFVDSRFSYLSDEEKMLFSDYLYQISADVGSGEYALAGILAPGAWAREPLHHRIRLLSMPCHFLYGDHDWMDYRHAMEASQSMTVKNSIVQIANAGHHLYIDNPDIYNAEILKLLRNSI